jgi:hypothetical protein
MVFRTFRAGVSGHPGPVAKLSQFGTPPQLFRGYRNIFDRPLRSCFKNIGDFIFRRKRSAKIEAGGRFFAERQKNAPLIFALRKSGNRIFKTASNGKKRGNFLRGPSIREYNRDMRKAEKKSIMQEKRKTFYDFSSCSTFAISRPA